MALSEAVGDGEKPGRHAKVAVLGKLLPLVVETVPFPAAARLSHGIPADAHG